MDLNKGFKNILIFVGILAIVGLLVAGNKIAYNILAILIYILWMIRTYVLDKRKKLESKMKGVYLIFAYTILVSLQYVYFAIFSKNYSFASFFYFITHWIGISLLLSIIFMERVFLLKEYATARFPYITEKNTFQFVDIYHSRNKIKKLKESLSYEALQEVVMDIPRHSAYKYVNEGSLTESYFDSAIKTLDDLYIYIVISNTGSAASDIISVFTQKSYNHASLAFDYDLDTIISYNGGEKVYPPGLNQEMIEYFNKKKDASIMVYRLPISKEKKHNLIDKVRQINTEGSAYNLMGLVFKYSKLENIMFCSQFIYSMLKYVGLEYFEKEDELVKPTDLVELDYYRKLEYCYSLFFDDQLEKDNIG